MSREKQIEEMARVIHKADENCCEYFPISMSECLHKHGRFRTNAATELYNAGYRKQSEGEWVVKNVFFSIYKCSICGEENSYKDGHSFLSDFCPHCGAKMKGGAEDEC